MILLDINSTCNFVEIIILIVETKKVDIINFDTHFELRPVEMKGNLGTPFYQIITELKNINEQIGCFTIGIQQQSNTQELF